MGFTQHVTNVKRPYYIARYLGPEGTYVTVKDDVGKSVKYAGKREAQKAANDAEGDVRAGRLKQAAAPAEVISFSDWANTWYGALRLAETTMANYRNHLGLALTRFGEHMMTDAGFPAVEIDAWEQDLLDAGYEPESVRTYRATLHTCLEDAVPSLLSSNPATRKKGRGMRGVARARAMSKKEKVITTVLGGLLVAERMSILTGRPDEFHQALVLQHGAMRLAESVGLETCHVHPLMIRVEWQLVEVKGKLIKAIPKYGSRGDVVIAPFLGDLLDGFMRSQVFAPCPCHGATYLFRGLRPPRGVPVKAGVTIAAVAEAAGVSTGTVSNVITRPDTVTARTRAKVDEAVRALGWVPGSAPIEPAWHWRRSGFEELFHMAASGRFPDRKRRRGLAGQPVPLTGDWPGIRVTGRNAARKAEWCWVPVADGLTPHGLRHAMRTWMEEQRVHPALAEDQMRHERTGIDVYRHATDAMRQEYRELAEAAWNEAVARRGELSAWSPVPVVARLLRAHAAGPRSGFVSKISQRTDPIVAFSKKKQAAE